MQGRLAHSHRAGPTCAGSGAFPKFIQAFPHAGLVGQALDRSQEPKFCVGTNAVGGQGSFPFSIETVLSLAVGGHLGVCKWLVGLSAEGRKTEQETTP